MLENCYNRADARRIGKGTIVCVRVCGGRGGSSAPRGSAWCFSIQMVTSQLERPAVYLLSEGLSPNLFTPDATGRSVAALRDKINASLSREGNNSNTNTVREMTFAVRRCDYSESSSTTSLLLFPAGSLLTAQQEVQTLTHILLPPCHISHLTMWLHLRWLNIPPPLFVLVYFLRKSEPRLCIINLCTPSLFKVASVKRRRRQAEWSGKSWTCGCLFEFLHARQQCSRSSELREEIGCCKTVTEITVTVRLRVGGDGTITTVTDEGSKTRTLYSASSCRDVLEETAAPSHVLQINLFNFNLSPAAVTRPLWVQSCLVHQNLMDSIKLS